MLRSKLLLEAKWKVLKGYLNAAIQPLNHPLKA